MYTYLILLFSFSNPIFKKSNTYFFQNKMERHSRSPSPFRIGKSMAKSESVVKKRFVFSLENLKDLLLGFAKKVYELKSFTEQIVPLWVNLYVQNLSKNPKFSIEDDNIYYLGKLDNFQFTISEIEMENIFNQMYKEYVEIYKIFLENLKKTQPGHRLLSSQALPKKSNFISKSKAEFKSFNEKFINVLENNLKVAIGTRLQKHKMIYKTSDTSMEPKNINSLFLERFFEKMELGSLFYLKYIENMNDNVCVPILDTEEIIDEIKKLMKSPNEKLNKYKEYNPPNEKFVFQALQIIFENYTTELVLDENGKLFVTDTFQKLFNKCLKNSDKRFIVSFFSFKTEDCYHMNILIYDRNTNEVERFEPNGSSAYEIMEECQEEELDKYLEKYFKGLNIDYISPQVYCPNIGIQQIFETEDSEYEVGFCVTWSFLYANERLLHPELSRKETTKSMIKKLEKYIQKNGNYYDYFTDRISQILSFYSGEIDKINKELGTKFYIDGRTLSIQS